ncbi:MAG: flagellar hook-length control protein FliK [Hyphomicrobium sp.]|nr:flagellar hook-length control protein FliK [Hyphomicrobium sp.]
MTVSPILHSPAAANVYSSRDDRTSAIEESDDFSALLPAESVFGWRSEVSIVSFANLLDVALAPPDQKMLLDQALVTNAEQQFQSPMSYLHGPAVPSGAMSGSAPLQPLVVVEVQGKDTSNRLPVTAEASDSVRSVNAGWNAKAAGELATPSKLSSEPTNFSALIADEVQVLSLANHAFHRPASLGARGELRGEDGPSLEIHAGERLTAQVPEKLHKVPVPSPAEVHHLSATDEKAALAIAKQSQPNVQAVGGASDLRLDLPRAGTDLTATVGESPRSADVAHQIASAFRELLDDRADVGGTSQPAAESTSVAYQSSLRVLDIVLQPQDLGRVSIKLRLSASGLTVALEAEKNTTLQLLQQEARALSDRLISDGYDVESLSVQQLFSATATPMKEVAASVTGDHRGGSEGTERSGQGNSGSASRGSDDQSRHRGSRKENALNAVADPAEPSRLVRKHLYV